MAIKLTYDEQQKLLTIKSTGAISLQEAEQAMLKIISCDKIPDNTNALWDVSEMEFANIDLDFQMKFIELRKRFDRLRGKAKVAILSNYSLADPVLKMHTILAKELQQSTRVFAFESDAYQWLYSERRLNA